MDSEEKKTNKKIGAILVLYNPNLNQTLPAIKSLEKQVDEICLIDNTPGQNIANEFIDIQNIHYIALGENRGIAAAQNVGIRYFINQGFDLVLFSDQDSSAPVDIVSSLIDVYYRLTDVNIAIAAIGTRAINKQTNIPYPSKSKELGTPKEIPETTNITECYSIISSISIIPLNALRLVGGFDEGLFIDGVDHEWCWRAWHNNKLRSFIAEDAKILHMLGEGDQKIGSKSVAISSVFRVYFQFRNFIWLKKRRYTPHFWIKKNKIKYFFKMLYYPIMVKPRIKYLKNIIYGIRDGYFITDNSSWPKFE